MRLKGSNSRYVFMVVAAILAAMTAMAASVFYGVAITPSRMSSILGWLLIGLAFAKLVFIASTDSDKAKWLRFAFLCLLMVNSIGALGLLTSLFGNVDFARAFGLFTLVLDLIAAFAMGIYHKK